MNSPRTVLCSGALAPVLVRRVRPLAYVAGEVANMFDGGPRMVRALIEGDHAAAERMARQPGGPLVHCAPCGRCHFGGSCDE